MTSENFPILRFSDFNKEWEKKSLNQIAEITSSKRVFKEDYVENGVLFFRGKEISELKKHSIPEDVLYISNVAFEEFREKYGVPQNGDLLLTAVGTLANSWLVDLEQPFYFKDGNLIWFKKINVHPKFLEITLDAKKSNVLATAIGSSQKALTIVEIKKLKFYFPAPDEQQKIADYLSSVDKKISLLKEKHTLLTQYKKGVIQKLFKQEIRFKDDNGNDFPDWQTIPLSKLASKNSVKNKDESVNAVLTNSAKDGIVNQGDYFKKDIANQQNLGGYTVVEKNDFVYNPRISELAPVGPIKRNHIGQGVMSPLYTVFRFKDDSLLDYLELYFNTTMWHRYMHSIANFGARHDRMNITTSDFYALPLPIPSEEERAKIVSYVNALAAKVNAVKRQVELTQTFKKGLLQQMFV